jgi:nitroimidazol reductase NimA-like FMN-containing flavoprotein (pyridoxamine 5'-phosphate oxidase superfamily)
MAPGNGPADGPGAPAVAASEESQDLGPRARDHALRAMSPTECYDLLERGGIGRVGFTAPEGVMVLPVIFAMTGRGIIFRTAPDTLLALHANAHFSFEVDHFDEVLHEGWSVLVQGHAHQVTDEREVKHLEAAARLEPWAPGARDVYVRIAPTQITGRRIQPR